MNTPVFFIDKSKSGQWYFVLKAGNGEIIATSEMYNSKQACYNGIDSVIACSIRAEIKERTNFKKHTENETN